jgi:hypothetical protein
MFDISNYDLIQNNNIRLNEANIVLLKTDLNTVSGNLNIDYISPLTTKGDILTFDTKNTRLPVGLSGQVLTSTPTHPTGLQYKNKSFYTVGVDFASNFGLGRSRAIGAAATFRFTFFIPFDFYEWVSLGLIIVPANT